MSLLKTDNISLDCGGTPQGKVKKKARNTELYKDQQGDTELTYPAYR